MSTLDPLAGQRPAPVPCNFTKPFWDAARECKLLLQYDPDAGKYQFYPRPISIFSGRRNLEWREASGKGTIYTYTVSYKAPPPFKGVSPFIVVTVELSEGVRVMTNLINCPPDQVKIGMPVRLAWVKAGELNFPVFEPD
ncbi:MAG TPA: Zn-ribbon domain-containing OB-fold protein [Xanthobacteraceae bacterium]|nr:Zn-ribbon domain-containing OB-fold protein [Xanthobacteraceae bacterium]